MSITTQKQGFTIVELMIVIIVIAILAAITIVAYTGVQSRAHDSAVQQDLRQLGTALEIFRSHDGQYPAANSTGVARFAEEDTAVSPGSYSEGFFNPSGLPHNMAYCRARDDSAVVLVAQSRGGNILAYADGSVYGVDGLDNLVTIADTCRSSSALFEGLDEAQFERVWIYNAGQWLI